MLDFLSRGNRVEIGLGSVVVISLLTGIMREYTSIQAAYAVELTMREAYEG